MKRNLLYSFTCLAFITIIGGAVYEHLNVVPGWSAAPPASLSMFQGPYGLKPEVFWMIIHPVNLVLFLVTLIIHWKSPRKTNLLIVLISYVIILAVTAVYFVPELIKIITTPFSDSVSGDMVSRASLWETLSIIRLVILIILSLVLLTGLTKHGNRIEGQISSGKYR
jgi:hypothetical protein